MDRFNQILCHPIYMNYLEQIEYYEKDRIYCKHDLEHFLSVGRIAWIINLEQHQSHHKELIYTIGLLHDIGRLAQYTSGLDHAQAGVELSRPLLVEVGFSEVEIEIILEAISAHQYRSMDTDLYDLKQLIQQADKLSRNCFQCKASISCKWPNTKKNERIFY